MVPAEPREACELLARARRDHGAELGNLLELYRDYLQKLARVQVGTRLRGLVNASDLVQETFLEAFRDFGQFHGTTEAQWRAWLRHILAHNLATLVEKQLRAHKRDRRRQVAMGQPDGALEGPRADVLVSPVSSPSSQAQHHEAGAVLAEQLARLPGPYREVLMLRNLEGLSFDQVAQRMGRTPGAVRVLWLRALDRLRQLLINSSFSEIDAPIQTSFYMGIDGDT
jgi:RNA polymerase sigma-70 factor (ECF subfamily)